MSKVTSTDYREAYNKGQELVPDFAYDAAFGTDGELDDIGQGELVDHMHFMGSLPTYFEDLDTIDAKRLAELGITKEQYPTITLSYKLDGVPGSCILGPTGWLRCVSRGKRFQGFLMSSEFLKILPQPKQLPDHEIDFRGEFVMSKADFEILNNRHGCKQYANPRSMVSAQINSKEPDMNILRCIKWFAHGIWDDQPGDAYNYLMNRQHFDMLHAWLQEQDTCCNIESPRGEFWQNVNGNIKAVYEAAMNYDYPCDGIVLQYRVTADNDAHCNLDRIAIKQFDEAKFSAETTVKSIEWRLANNGSYFPRLHFEPVEINGSEVNHAAGYCWDYLQRLGLSVGAKVIVTMRGGVIPYVSKVLEAGQDNYEFPEDAAKPEPGDIQLWSTNSEDAIRRLKFVRGMTMLDLKDCGVQMFNDMYDAGMHNLFDVASLIERGEFERQMHYNNVVAGTPAGAQKIATITERFKTFNYVWLILALRENNIGFSAANAIGQVLSGYHLVDTSVLNRKAIRSFLDNKELVDNVKAYAKPVALEHADLSIERQQQQTIEQPNAVGRKKVCMSKKPTDGSKKADFAAKYLGAYDITENIKEANVLVCPRGENSNKIRYAEANGIEIKYYEDFIEQN
jgi:NAD-dependent DNA ligase